MNTAMKLLVALQRFYASSIGKKLIVAVTGAMLLLFVLGHMLGNLLVYQGEDAINSYAAWLKGAAHGWGVWAARFGLLGAFVVHIVATIHLTVQNREARSDRYAHESTVQAPLASRIMIISGTIILCFVIYHLMHFTLGVANDYLSYHDSQGRHDVHRMVIEGFSWWPASLFYIFSVALLCHHLSHGFSSVFQTLGLRTERSWPAITLLGKAYAAVILIGNCSIPIAVLTGILHH